MAHVLDPVAAAGEGREADRWAGPRESDRLVCSGSSAAARLLRPEDGSGGGGLGRRAQPRSQVMRTSDMPPLFSSSHSLYSLPPMPSSSTVAETVKFRKVKPPSGVQVKRTVSC